MVLKPGDLVVRDRTTWRFLDLDEPRAGLGVGEVVYQVWLGPDGLNSRPNAVTVRWGGVYRCDLMHHLRIAWLEDEDEDGRDFDDDEVLWAAVGEEWARSYGEPLTPPFLDELRQRYDARQIRTLDLGSS